ncbi:MAG: acyl-CoA desaturase [Burkholderiales bacterium]|nr:MAG: acyl-CoA desaturase [Burkholderiales bacterium]
MRKKVWRIDGSGANATDGQVVWSPAKSIWNLAMFVCAIVLAPIYFSWAAFLFFLIFTYISMLLGHSLGMHRRLIHRSYECSKPLEYFLVWLGALVGMAGPFGILKIHDLRDWAQRQEKCHDFFAHRRGLLMDAFWQLNCVFKFSAPPAFKIEDDFANDKFYIFLEKTWELQQALFGIFLFWIGGMPLLVWGVFVRVAVSVSSHWIVTYYAHNPGLGNWKVHGAAVQASNLSRIALLTHGECWHNNHHAFPESAKMGLDEGQLDVGWIVLRWLEKLGWVWNLGLPRDSLKREDLNFEVDFLLK